MTELAFKGLALASLGAGLVAIGAGRGHWFCMVGGPQGHRPATGTGGEAANFDVHRRGAGGRHRAVRAGDLLPADLGQAIGRARA